MFTNLSEACCEAKRWKHLLNLTWLYTKASQTFSGTFSGTLLNLTWLCIKASRNLLRNLLQKSLQTFCTWPGSASKPPRPSPEPSSEPCWTWPGFPPKPPGTVSGTFFGTLLKLTWLCTKASPGSAPKPLTPSPEPSPEPCWTWPGLCTKASQTFSGTFSRTLLNLTWSLHQSLPDLRNLLRNPVEPDLALHQSLPDLDRNLRNLLRNLVEPDPAPAPMHTGAILGWRPH